VSQADERDPALELADEAQLLLALEAALRPTALDPELNERLICFALEDPLAPASDAELLESARLRDALEGPTGGASPAVLPAEEYSDAATLRALQVAFQPHSASDELLARVLGSEVALTAAPVSDQRRAPKKKTSVVYAAFGVSGIAVSLAAGFALLATGTRNAPSTDLPSLVKPRSTAALFSERFETEATSARIDRIASARSRDLRDNRYAAWGVK